MPRRCASQRASSSALRAWWCACRSCGTCARTAKTLSAEIAQDLHRREFSFREKILLFLRQSRGERDRTTAMGILWNRCLRKIFISVFVNTVVTTATVTAAAPAADDAMDWREVVQRCFVDMNELEQAAVEKWLAHNSLDSLLEHEMPESGDTVVPTQLVPEAAAVQQTVSCAVPPAVPQSKRTFPMPKQDRLVQHAAK